MTPAEELRAAATKLREAAAKATRGPWVYYQTTTRSDHDEDVAWTVCRPLCLKDNNGDECEPDCGADVLRTGAENCEHDYISQGDVEWMTLVDPGVAEPLAKWLEAAADHWDAVRVAGATPPGPEALTFAHMITGGR